MSPPRAPFFDLARPPSRPLVSPRTRALGCFTYRLALGKSFGLDLGAASGSSVKEGGSKYVSNVVLGPAIREAIDSESAGEAADHWVLELKYGVRAQWVAAFVQRLHELG